MQDEAQLGRALPASLSPLIRLAYDLRWTWRPSIRALFSSLDPEAWQRARGHPLACLREASAQRLERAAAEPSYLSHLRAVLAELGVEDDAEPRHPGARRMREQGDRIAYFCAEFGLTEFLPIYAGGLGVLAGDYLKSASDLRLPVVGVGLLYREGYFRQEIGPDGRQRELNPALDPGELPICLARTSEGAPAEVAVRINGRDVRIGIWIARVGRVSLVLLDANQPENTAEDREITARLYGGDHETRIRQEIVLGIGGLRALDLLGLRPSIRHLNEGHASFVGLEKIRQLMREEGLSFEEGREVAALGNVFTTHTPVPAGIDRFPPELVRAYLADFIQDLGLTPEAFADLGHEMAETHRDSFSMAALALRLSSHANAVSRLHARVARRLWLGLLPELADKDVRILPITNGVHRPTWTDPEIATFSLLESPGAVDRAAFWECHERLRGRLVEECRRRLVEHWQSLGASPELVAAAETALDPKALTIGFARRFATYKRATLLFSDPNRLAHLLRDPQRPVQILFAGKAHPKDDAGKEFLHAIAAFADSPEFRGRVVMLPDYEMGLARALVSGCDVWLNTPIRPHEASGTSGMKAGMNGVLNASVRDGWWDEASNDEVGFVIGSTRDDGPDADAAVSLYELLEREVVPLFYDRDPDGLPGAWVEKMIRSANSIGRQFSSDRMVNEYLELCYLEGLQALEATARAAREGSTLRAV
jgi:starch phosphorylase